MQLETPNSSVTAQIARKAAGDSGLRLSLSPAFEKGQEAAQGVAQVEQHFAIQHLGGVLHGCMRCVGRSGMRGVAGVSGGTIRARISGGAVMSVVRSSVSGRRACVRYV